MDRAADEEPRPSLWLSIVIGDPSRYTAAHLFNDERFSDLTLIVGERRFHAHRAVLEGAAPLLAAKFEPAMPHQTLRVDGVQPGIYLELLRHVYTGKANASGERRCEELLVAAAAAGAGRLKGLCGLALADQLGLENALRLYELARLHDVFALRRRAQAFIVQHAAAICRRAELRRLDADALCDLFGALANDVVKRENKWRKRCKRLGSRPLSDDTSSSSSSSS